MLIGQSVTGQLFLRGPMAEQGGKKIFMVVGVIGVSAEEAEMINSESQYTIAGLQLINPVDMKEKAMGLDADGLLTSPIWRV